MNKRPVRIAITGTSGVGKTTLAKALAEKYEVPYIPEDWNQLFAALIEFKKEKKDPKNQKLQYFVRELNAWLKHRNQICDDLPRFVIDRCVYDILKLAIHEHIFSKESQAIKSLIQKSTNFSKKINCIVVPPVSKFMTQELANQSGMKRNNDLHHKIYSQSLTIGLLEQFCHTQKIYLDENQTTTQKRMAKRLISH
jgi:predicted ATPase